MPREHVEFIHAQAIPWNAESGRFDRTGAAVRVLSEDPVSGACSTVIRYPGGWSAASTNLSDDEEFFVLAGELTLNNMTYGAGDYAYLPAGYVVEHRSSQPGATVLTFFEAAQSDHFVERIATRTQEKIAASDPVVASERVSRQLLKPDSVNGERTWILHIDGSADNPFIVDGVERHPCVEEMFLLDGEFVMGCGRMRRGAYFWRPPMIPHGPMGTDVGFSGFFRAKEGNFSTQWSDAESKVDWRAAYLPTLPDHLKPYADFEAGAADF